MGAQHRAVNRSDLPKSPKTPQNAPNSPRGPKISRYRAPNPASTPTAAIFPPMPRIHPEFPPQIHLFSQNPPISPQNSAPFFSSAFISPSCRVSVLQRPQKPRVGSKKPKFGSKKPQNWVKKAPKLGPKSLKFGSKKPQSLGPKSPKFGSKKPQNWVQKASNWSQMIPNLWVEIPQFWVKTAI